MLNTFPVTGFLNLFARILKQKFRVMFAMLIKSSRPKVFYKNEFLKILQNLQENLCVIVSIRKIQEAAILHETQRKHLEILLRIHFRYYCLVQRNVSQNVQVNLASWKRKGDSCKSCLKRWKFYLSLPHKTKFRQCH